MRIPRLATLLVLLVLPELARAQQPYGLFPEPVDVTLSDLLANAESYRDRAVRTRGRLELGTRARMYLLRDTFGSSALIVPMTQVASHFEDAALRLLGQEIEVTGEVSVAEMSGAGFQPDIPRVVIRFWGFEGPPEREAPKSVAAAPRVTLQALVSSPGQRDGQLVRVVGKFRGRNLYGDLPSRSQRARSHWVIKDDAFAVWVMDKKPKGDGFDLDASLKRDTGKWLEVVGRPVTRGGVTYIRAAKVTLTGPPSETAEVKPPPPPPERPKVPPVIVFALPLDGDGEVAPDSRFVVQFNKDMDEATFKGRVRLRYSGPVLPGDRPLDGLRLTYDRGRRALTVDPGTPLEPGRQVELLLLPGIVDVEGLALTARSQQAQEGAVEILRYLVAG